MDEPEGVFRGSTDTPSRPRRLEVLAEPVTVRKLWAGRSRTSAIYVQLISRANGDNVAELRAHHLDSAGRMQPGPAITLSIHRLPELAAALLAAHRRAVELHLIERRGQE